MQPALDVPFGMQPALDVPFGMQPALDVPFGMQPALDVPSGMQPALDVPSGMQPASDVPSGMQPASDVPSGMQPASDVPSGMQPASDMPLACSPRKARLWRAASVRRAFGMQQAGSTCAASGGGGLAVAALARRGLRRLLRWRASRCGAGRNTCRLRRRRLGRRCARAERAAPAPGLARVTLWRRAAHVPPHGGGLAVAALARHGLRRLLRWRASRCGARRHVCSLRR